MVQFYSCPNRFVPRSVAQWHRLFRFREIDFPHTMPAFEALGRRYIAFREYFLSMKNEMQAAIAVSGEAS